MPSNSAMSRMSYPGRHCFNQLCEIIDTWAPVSQRASVSSLLSKHFTVHLRHTRRTTCACSCGDKWLTKTPAVCLSSLHFHSSKEDMDWQSVLCCLQCSCWHLFEQYLTALQLLHCLKKEVLSLLPQNLQTWWDESAPATPCPADAASNHFPTPVYILFQTDLLNPIWSSDRSCLHLLSCMNYTVEAETVTGYQMHKAW